MVKEDERGVVVPDIDYCEDNACVLCVEKQGIDSIVDATHRCLSPEMKGRIVKLGFNNDGSREECPGRDMAMSKKLRLKREYVSERT